jgi:hypothetical protein
MNLHTDKGVRDQDLDLSIEYIAESPVRRRSISSIRAPKRCYMTEYQSLRINCGLFRIACALPPARNLFQETINS